MSPHGKDQPGIHLLCIGLSEYRSPASRSGVTNLPPLTSAAISALNVLRAFYTLARPLGPLLPIRSHRLVVAPSPIEDALIRRLCPNAVGEWEAGRSAGTHSDLVEAFNSFAEVSRSNRADVAIVYFAGHGLDLKSRPDTDDRTVLLASNFDFDFQGPPRGVLFQHVLRQLCPTHKRDEVARSQIFLLDCCRDRSWNGDVDPELYGLSIPGADREVANPAAVDDRRRCVHYACVPGASTSAGDNHEKVLEPQTTNYARALLDQLHPSRFRPPCSVASLLQDVYEQLAARDPDNSKHLLGPNAPRDFSLIDGSEIKRRDLSPSSRSEPPGAVTPKKPPNRILAGSVVVLALGYAGWWVGTTEPAPAANLTQAASNAAPTRGAPSLPVGTLSAVSATARAPAVPADMVLIPATVFRAGSTVEEATLAFRACRRTLELGGPGAGSLPCKTRFEDSVFVRESGLARAEVPVAAFLLDRHEVTTADFLTWLRNVSPPVEGDGKRGYTIRTRDHAKAVATARPVGSGIGASPIRYDARGFFAEQDALMRPVTHVSWAGANEYCRDHDKRLPREVEWEVAARGRERRATAWGDDLAPPCDGVAYARAKGAPCADRGEHPNAVGASSLDVTPEGIYDLGGNVAEWVEDKFEPIASADPCEQCRVFRGGSYADPGTALRAALRSRAEETDVAATIGFRCARELL